MKNKLRFIPLLALAIPVLTGCNLEVFADGDDLMTAINYTEDTRIIYSKDEIYKTPSGRVVSKGDYKPVWRYIQNKLNLTLKEHQGAANSGEKKSVSYFRDNWLNKPYADISMGTVDAITKYSVQGNSETILDLKPYMFERYANGKYKIEDNNFVIKGDTPLPHLARFLYSNPGVLNSITTGKHSRPDLSAVYYVPYFDGFDDLEKATMVRADFIQKVFNEYTNESGTKVKTEYVKDKTFLGSEGKYKIHYTPFDIESENKTPERKCNVPALNDSGEPTGETIELTKNETENIIYQQNKLFNGDLSETYSDGATTENLVKQFKAYVNNRYGKPKSESEGTGPLRNYSDLFLGYNACYDADEMVALMRIIKTAPKTIFGSDSKKEMVPWFPTECSNQRSADLYRWAASMFGIRGLESRTGYLYLNGQQKAGDKTVDKVHDCRGDKNIQMMCERLNALYKEGLLLQEFDVTNATGTTDGKFARELIINDGELSNNMAGFMEYAYFQSEGALNDDKKQTKPINYRPIIGPACNWDTDGDGKSDTYMQFTESWASVKTSALILRAGLTKTPNKLAAAFRFVDYIFSPDGRAVYNYGPSDDGYYYPGDFDPDTYEFIPAEGSKSITYKGKKIPAFTDEALKQNKELDSYLRSYVGATIPMGYEKLYGMSYQLTAKQTQKGIDIINNAIQCKTFRHVCIKNVTEEYSDVTDSKKQTFYKIVPSTFVLTSGQNTAIANILDKNKLGSIFTDDSKTRFNIWDGYVTGNKESYAPALEDYISTVKNKWEIDKLVTYYQDAYEYAVL